MITNDICDELMAYAKLPQMGFYKTVQTITFSQDFNKEHYSIFNVNKDIVNALEKNQSNDKPIELSIKGTDTDQAVMCTNDRTYEISESETSNTLLIIPHLELNAGERDKENDQFKVFEVGVLSSCNKIYDLKERHAKIGEVYKLLTNYVLHHHIGDEFADNAYTFTTLLDNVLMSKLELEQTLKILKIYNYGDNRLRLLHVDYLSCIITSIIDSALENDCDIRAISQNSVHSVLDSLYPKCILDQTLQFYFSPVSLLDGDTLWEIDDIEIAKCYAEQILNETGEMSVSTFLNEWRKKCPEEIEVSLSYLIGMAIIHDNIPAGSVIKLLKSVSLPDDLESRFRELFAQKSHWKQHDLEGYVQDIVPKNGSASQLLVRYCRCSNLGSVKMFSKR